MKLSDRQAEIAQTLLEERSMDWAYRDWDYTEWEAFFEELRELFGFNYDTPIDWRPNELDTGRST